MARKALQLTFVAMVIGLAPQIALGFTVDHLQSQSTGRSYPVRWKEGIQQIRFQMCDQPLVLLPNFASDSTPIAAVEAAMQGWAFSPVAPFVEGTSPRTDVGQDGINLITFADTPANRDAVGDNLDAPVRWFTRASNESHWDIVEADIILNPAQSFAMDGQGGAYDLQAVLTRDLGHTLGLSHSADAAAAMAIGMFPGELRSRFPEPDDIAAVENIYTGPTDSRHGAVSGHVLTTAGDPVFGAQVAPVNSQGIVAVTVVTERDGSYTLPWLSPSPYYIYAEPLDPQQPTSNFSYDYYHDANRSFRIAFLGGNANEQRGQRGRGANPPRGGHSCRSKPTRAHPSICRLVARWKLLQHRR